MTEEQQDKKIVKEELLDTLDEYFSRGVDRKKFIDVNRIPLICQDISNIHKSISKIEEYISWLIKLVVGGVVLALLAMIFK